MAYVFNKTMNMMGKGDEDQQSNIFGDESASLFGPAPKETEQSYKPDVKTSVEGSLQAPSKESGGGKSAQKSIDSSTTVAPSAELFKRNIGKQKAPKAVGEAESGIKQASADLQKEAEDYLGAESAYKAPEQTQIKSAVKGDETAFSNIASLLNQAPDQVEAFKPETDVDIERANELSTPFGLRTAIAKESGPKYTAGMGALDTALLGQDTGFTQRLEGVSRGQKELYEQADKATDEATKQRQENEAANLESVKNNLRNTLTTMSGAINQEAGTMAEKQNKFADFMRGNTQGLSEAEIAEFTEMSKELLRGQQDTAIEQAIAELGPEYEDAIRKAANSLDMNKFITGGNFGAENFYSQQQADEYNQIMDLLGLANTIEAGKGGEVGFNFDPYLRNIISSARFAQGLPEPVKEPSFRSKIENIKPEVQGQMDWWNPGTTYLPDTYGQDPYDPSMGDVDIPEGDFSQTGSFAMPDVSGYDGFTDEQKAIMDEVLGPASHTYQSSGAGDIGGPMPYNPITAGAKAVEGLGPEVDEGFRGIMDSLFGPNSGTEFVEQNPNNPPEEEEPGKERVA